MPFPCLVLWGCDSQKSILIFVSGSELFSDRYKSSIQHFQFFVASSLLSEIRLHESHQSCLTLMTGTIQFLCDRTHILKTIRCQTIKLTNNSNDKIGTCWPCRHHNMQSFLLSSCAECIHPSMTVNSVCSAGLSIQSNALIKLVERLTSKCHSPHIISF